MQFWLHLEKISSTNWNVKTNKMHTFGTVFSIFFSVLKKFLTAARHGGHPWHPSTERLNQEDDKLKPGLDNLAIFETVSKWKIKGAESVAWYKSPVLIPTAIKQVSRQTTTKQKQCPFFLHHLNWDKGEWVEYFTHLSCFSSFLRISQIMIFAAFCLGHLRSSFGLESSDTWVISKHTM